MVKKAVILLGGLGTRFLPITKAVPKEMLPIIDKPIFHYLIDEAYKSRIKEIILVVSSEKKKIIKDYIGQAARLEKILKKRGKNNLLKELQPIPSDISIELCEERNPLGDGHAILQTRNLVGEEAFGVFFCR